jgi:hypothetical protein
MAGREQPANAICSAQKNFCVVGFRLVTIFLPFFYCVTAQSSGCSPCHMHGDDGCARALCSYGTYFRRRAGDGEPVQEHIEEHPARGDAECDGALLRSAAARP